MGNSKSSSFGILMCISLSTIIVSLIFTIMSPINRAHYSNKCEINVGDKFLHSFSFDEVKEDPFTKIEINTIQVLDIKENYNGVKYISYTYTKYQDTLHHNKFSVQEELFRRWIKEIK